MTLRSAMLGFVGRIQLKNVLESPLWVPHDVDPRGYLDPGQVVILRRTTATYLLTTAGYGGRLEEVV